jgi:hypothetical protein
MPRPGATMNKTDMRTAIIRAVPATALLLFASVRAGAQTSVTLPDTSQTTTLTASVSEQATVTLPAGVTFNVTNVAAGTTASNASITVQNIVLATATKQLKISLMANAASFTPPVGGATTWSASDVSWSAPNSGPNAWVNAIRNNATLSSSTFVEAATCIADTASCSTTGFAFALAAKPTVKRSGNHTLTVTWKFESM